MTSVLETTLGRLVDDLAVRQPDRTAMRDLTSGESFTFAEFAEVSDRLARGLVAVGFNPGDHLALWGGSSIKWILAQYAAAKIGLVVVSADPDYNDDQMAYLLEQSEAKGVIAFGGYKERDFTQALQRICPEISRGGTRESISVRLPHLSKLIFAPASGHDESIPEGFIRWSDLIGRAEETPPSELDSLKTSIRPVDVTLISYTSGTTGTPKGVMCTHHGLINKSHLAASIQNLGPDDTTGLIVPLYHMFGNTCAVLTGLTRAAGLVLTGQWFEPGRALECLSKGGCTAIYGAPSQFIALMEHPDYPRHDLSRLRTGIMGGAPCPMEVMKKVVHDMGVSGISGGVWSDRSIVLGDVDPAGRSPGGASIHHRPGPGSHRGPDCGPRRRGRSADRRVRRDVHPGISHGRILPHARSHIRRDRRGRLAAHRRYGGHGHGPQLPRNGPVDRLD